MGRFSAALTIAGIALGCGRVSFDSRSDASGDSEIGVTDDIRPDTPPGPFCDPLSVTFCTDFAAGSAGWSNQEQVNGSFVFDPTGGPAPSGALVVTTNVGGASAEVSLLYGHAAPTTSLLYSFDVRIDVAGAGTPALGLAVFDGATSSHGLEYVYDPTGGTTNLEEIIDPDAGAPTFINYPVAGFPEDEWHRVSVFIAIGSPWMATVSIDGAQQSTHDLSDATNGTLAFSVGIPYLANTTSPWMIRISNVIVDVQ